MRCQLLLTRLQRASTATSGFPWLCLLFWVLSHRRPFAFRIVAAKIASQMLEASSQPGFWKHFRSGCFARCCPIHVDLTRLHDVLRCQLSFQSRKWSFKTALILWWGTAHAKWPKTTNCLALSAPQNQDTSEDLGWIHGSLGKHEKIRSWSDSKSPTTELAIPMDRSFLWRCEQTSLDQLIQIDPPAWIH